MQSQSHEYLQKDSLNQNTEDSRPSTQHGHDDSDQQSPHQPRADEGRSHSRRSASTISWSTSSSEGSDQSLERSLRGLRKSSPVNRIAEHETSLAHLPKKRSPGPSFAVVQRGRNATTGQVVLADFPNGLPENNLTPSLLALTIRRGSYPCLISSASFFVV